MLDGKAKNDRAVTNERANRGARFMIVDEKLVAAVLSAYGAGKLFRIVPRWHALEFAGLIDNLVPRNDAFFAGLLQQPIDALHVRATHGGDQARREQLITDATASNWVRLMGDLEHRLDQVDGLSRSAATLFGT